MTGGKWMGWWGHLGAPKQRGIAIYTLSPYEQRAFAGALHQAVFNTFRRVKGQAFYIAIPMGLAYATYSWGKKNHGTFWALGYRGWTSFVRSSEG
ncbi:ubiquinol--cytochrome-c reductase subunit 8 [Mortierella claussenii]|nr:ubiquinol--cytochrome-c reductase subunit 8 [Mortierella claussenii]